MCTPVVARRPSAASVEHSTRHPSSAESAPTTCLHRRLTLSSHPGHGALIAQVHDRSMLRHLLCASTVLTLVTTGGAVADTNPAAAAPSATTAGRRYVDRIFGAVDVTTDVVYATAPSLNDSSTETLLMDVYTPAGDTVTARPAIVFILSLIHISEPTRPY